MQAQSETFGIGQLSELSGLPIKTVRFYSDSGLLPASRTEAGHRRYSETDLARLQLIRSLRDLELDLPAIAGVLEGNHELADVLAAHAATLETRIRSLRRRLVVLRAASSAPTEQNLRRVHALARLDRAERRMLLESFWERAVGDAGTSEGSARLREAAMPELGDDPTPEQLEAWLELAELVSDEDFQRAVREQLAWPARAGFVETDEWQRDHWHALEMMRQAVSAGVEPDQPAACPAIDTMAATWAKALGREDGPAFRAWLADSIEAAADPRISRYWWLISIVRGEDPEPGRHWQWKVMDWMLEALRSRPASASSAPESG
jgi:DNA-binding transcriptional MerR regulator